MLTNIYIYIWIENSTSFDPFWTNGRFMLSVIKLTIHAVCCRKNMKCLINFALCRGEYSRSSFQPNKNFAILLAKQRAYVSEETDIATLRWFLACRIKELRHEIVPTGKHACGLRINIVFSSCSVVISELPVISIHKRSSVTWKFDVHSRLVEITKTFTNGKRKFVER